MPDHLLRVPLTVRVAAVTDLPGLGWTGGPGHVAALTDALQQTDLGHAALLVIGLPTGALVAVGGVDYRVGPVNDGSAGVLWMLDVHPAWQSLGVGTLLVRALEDRIRARGLGRARLGVEHDNPRAARLYRRLGYAEIGSALDAWPAAEGQSYVTVCAILEHRL
jgi:ribosomal protein S18 acetylase RimI-like enzyme